ncbi:MAG: aldehyde dehydrogenase family protein [Planctomycetes bacterium]|nr:aldehyde dehydrogenase family protein [Planctomycetota bacterium]
MDDITRVFEKQRANRWRVAQSTAAERIARLAKLRDAVLARRAEITQAIYDDFRKHPTESDLTEVFPTVAELNHTIKHLRSWMKPRRVGTPLSLFGTHSEIRYEPRGLVLVLSPWNYPFNLSVNPVAAAMAAGNCVILKPSTKVPHTSRLLKSLLGGLFDEGEVAVIEGDHATSDALLELPFDHIFFTGSPRIGKRVMAAAAKHLATVTLELGGKSPAIVDDTVDLRQAAERLLWGKFINAGQTCVAPDYLLIHESRVAPFVEEARRVLAARYGATDGAVAANENFCRLVSVEHAHGLRAALDAAVAAGAKIEVGGQGDANQRFLAPTLLSGVKEDSPIMQQEIFGPILPMITWRTLEEALATIRAREKPLALYIFSGNGATVETLLKGTSAGGSCVNSAVIHLANANLPFGGVGQSGMGSYHGRHGFETLSHARAVLRQGWLDVIRFFYPPYTGLVRRLTGALIKYLA